MFFLRNTFHIYISIVLNYVFLVVLVYFCSLVGKDILMHFYTI